MMCRVSPKAGLRPSRIFAGLALIAGLAACETTPDTADTGPTAPPPVTGEAPAPATLPVTLTGAWLIATRMPATIPHELFDRRPFDWIGAGLMLLLVGPLTYILVEGDRYNWFYDPKIVGLTITAALAFVAFVLLSGCRLGEALALQWRDLSAWSATDTERFIPVAGDAERAILCFIEALDETRVRVTDTCPWDIDETYSDGTKKADWDVGMSLDAVTLAAHKLRLDRARMDEVATAAGLAVVASEDRDEQGMCAGLYGR